MCNGQNIVGRGTEILTWKKENPDEGNEGTHIHNTNIMEEQPESAGAKKSHNSCGA
jgi:hypothetical protein